MNHFKSHSVLANMKVAILITCCLLTTSVIGKEDEWGAFEFDLEMSFETEGINNPVDTDSVDTIATRKSEVLLSPAAESQSVPVPVPEPTTKWTAAMKSNDTIRMDTKRKTPYSFEYAVEDSKSGLDYGHKVSSDGEVVTGTYYVLLPDGRKEIVNYKADVNGYVADVSYEGEAKNDNSQSQQSAGSIPSAAISAQLQAFPKNSSSISTLTTSTRPPETSPPISSVTTKGPSLTTLPAPAEPSKSANKSPGVTTTSTVSSTSSMASATSPTTTPSSLTSSAPNLNASSILSVITSTTTPTPNTTYTPTSSTNLPVLAATSVTTLPVTSSTSTSSPIPKSAFNSTLSGVSATASPSPAKSNQNSTSVSLPQVSPTQTNSTLTSSSTRSPESSTIPSIVSQTPGTAPSENQSFFQALARFIRSVGPTFIYCRNLLTSCLDSTSSQLTSSCSNCKNLQKICSKSEFTGQTYPIRNDTLQAFQSLIPVAPVWPAIKSAVTEVIQKVVSGSASSEKPPHSTVMVPTTTPFPFTREPQSSTSDSKNVSFEVPEGLADIIQSAETHFSYCQKIRSICPRLESTRPYWEGSPEIPSKQKEFFLSTIQACSYCRSLWPICSELESSEFLIDPSQLFTLHALEDDVRDAIFTISYCRNVTQDCKNVLKANQSTTVSPIPSQAPKTSNSTSPVLLSTTSPSPVPVNKPTPGPSNSSQLSESDVQNDGVLGETKFINYCIHITPICSQLLSF